MWDLETIESNKFRCKCICTSFMSCYGSKINPILDPVDITEPSSGTVATHCELAVHEPNADDIPWMKTGCTLNKRSTLQCDTQKESNLTDEFNLCVSRTIDQFLPWKHTHWLTQTTPTSIRWLTSMTSLAVKTLSTNTKKSFQECDIKENIRSDTRSN